MELYLSVGIDVGSVFSFLSIVNPQGIAVGKPFKIHHHDVSSLEKAVGLIKKAEELYSMESRTFLESTGCYHFPLFCYLIESGFRVFVINPLTTHSIKNMGIRKVKNDKVDSLAIARLGLTPGLKLSVMPVGLVLELRCLTRKYYELVDQRTVHTNQLRSSLSQAFPQFLPLFSNIAGKTAMMVLREYPTPKHLLRAHRKVLIAKLARTSRKGEKRCEVLYDRLMAAARAALVFGVSLDSLFFNVREELDSIEHFSGRMDRVVARMEQLVQENESVRFIQQVRLLESIPGVGFLSALTIMCEIGDFDVFQKPKQLVAYFGLDPAVKESGLFKATQVHISKRGSRVARRAVFSVALSSVSRKNNGDARNPVLREYYLKKIQSKPKMTALGAIMHKLCNVIFAVLRDHKPFVLRTPEEHSLDYQASRFAISA